MLNFMFLMFLILLISAILYAINFFISTIKNKSLMKMTPFECGFDPFSSSRLPFSIQFYMISIIFLIFDIEIIIFFPMIPSFIYLTLEYNFYIITTFIIILLLGLYMEWNDGALKWLT